MMMDFKEELLKYGAVMMPPASGEIMRVQAALGAAKRIMMPNGLVEFYENLGAILLGDAEIFGLVPAKSGRGKTRSLLEVNEDFAGAAALGRKTVFGRNGLFFLAVSEELEFVLLDIYTMRTVKKYDSVMPAIRDCLLVGAI